jgi:alpha-ketoglutarate-dependent taurine dioxygenase
MYSAYDALSKPMQIFLEGLTATHDAEMFRDQASRYNFQLFAGPRGHPENVGTNLRTVHPIIRTNPVTGWKGLYVNKTFTKRINELSKDESETLLQHLFRHIADNFNYQVRYTWEEDDVA